MAVLDTDLLVAYLRRIPDARNWVENQEDEEPFYITPIQLLELFKGAFQSERQHENVVEIRKLISGLEILQITSQSAETFGKIFATLKDEGVLIGEFDMIIASVALANSQPVVTRNTDHFNKVQGLIVIRW
ncbi:MAG: type II toxin-antitoxin system VapC family toxin [Candidatus Thorarchaeota archaeon]